MSNQTCRYPSCSNDRRDEGCYAGRFCSDECEVKHDHIKADAKEARLSEQPAPKPDPGRRP